MLRIARDVYFLLITTTAFACSGGSFLGSAGKNRGTLAVKNSAEASAYASIDLSTPCIEVLTSILHYFESGVGDSHFIVKGFEFANMQTLVTDLADWYQQELEDTTLRDIQSEDYDPDILLENLSTYSLNYEGLDSSTDVFSLRVPYPWSPDDNQILPPQQGAAQIQQVNAEAAQIVAAQAQQWQQHVQQQQQNIQQQQPQQPNPNLPPDYYDY